MYINTITITITMCVGGRVGGCVKPCPDILASDKEDWKLNQLSESSLNLEKLFR